MNMSTSTTVSGTPVDAPLSSDSSNMSTVMPVHTNILTLDQKATAKEILEIIKGSTSVLMHCHPSPDPDSLGSVLAMKSALESLGKKVTIIAGDSTTPKAFSHFPGFSSILPQNYFETDLTQFDLFLALDSGSQGQISRKGEVVFPAPTNPQMKSVVIDHHASNPSYAQDANLVAVQYMSTTEILFDLFQEWGINLTSDIATNIYVGFFTDSGGFRYERVTDHSFHMASVLYSYAPDMTHAVKLLENSASKGYIDFLGLALTQKKVFDSDGKEIVDGNERQGSFVLSYITQNDILRLGLQPDNWNGNEVSNTLKTVVGWNVTALLIEEKPSEVKISFRTRDHIQFDVSKVALSLGGGGHKAAAGAVVRKPIEEAIGIVAEAIQKVLFS